MQIMDADKSTSPPPSLDAAYSALKSHDARFDGQFFIGVRTTGIYCRPVCRVRAPLKKNCTVFARAAQAEQAGYRPCLRCRPELAPQRSLVLLNAALANAAAKRFENVERVSVAQVARDLGVSARHLRRIFEAGYGVSPLAYALTHRMLLAKRLLTDSTRSVAYIAGAAGFGSVRQLNTAFATRYHFPPSALRRRESPSGDATNALTLVVRKPYAFEAMFAFFAKRALPGMEVCVPGEMAYLRTFAFEHAGGRVQGWLRVAKLPHTPHLSVTVSDSIWPAIAGLLPRLERAFDIHADSEAIDEQLGGLCTVPGLRVPGAMEPFELAVRAILGQQVTVIAANQIAARLVARFGEKIATPFPDLSHLFPTATRLAQQSVPELAECRIIRTRAQTIITMAEQCAAGTIDLSGKADAEATIAQLRAIKGIGPWTAQYIAMRALRMPDAFPVGDVALRKAAGVTTDAQLLAHVEHARPWRAYAVINLWNSLST
jgi:AraC family transcriptional regulator, regulatory protein of adaptative response / DNA-3-methyladenine glycosylase II